MKSKIFLVIVIIVLAFLIIGLTMKYIYYKDPRINPNSISSTIIAERNYYMPDYDTTGGFAILKDGSIYVWEGNEDANLTHEQFVIEHGVLANIKVSDKDIQTILTNAPHFKTQNTILKLTPKLGDYGTTSFKVWNEKAKEMVLIKQLGEESGINTSPDSEAIVNIIMHYVEEEQFSHPNIEKSK